MRAVASLCIGTLLLTAALSAGEPAPAPVPPQPTGAAGLYSAVTVEPGSTSAYLAKISLAMPPLARSSGAYTSDYAVKVFPFFFFNEHGRISIEFSDDQLQRLKRGETVAFKGRGISSGGGERRVEGHAVADAAGADHGRIKVRIRYSKNIELVFNTAYRFTGKE